MKTKTKLEPHRFELRQLGLADAYYLERIVQLEMALAEVPRRFQIDILGECQMPSDTALLIRSVLMQRSPKTQLIINARSSICGGSVLVWLMGDIRMIRDDAKVFFRRVDESELNEVELNEAWKNPESSDDEPDSEANPAEDEYARVLEGINEFLPVKEMAGRMIGVPVLRQFGLVENQPLDRFLATAFGPTKGSKSTVGSESKLKRARAKVKSPKSIPAQR